jgi:hypothetical protein
MSHRPGSTCLLVEGAKHPDWVSVICSAEGDAALALDLNAACEIIGAGRSAFGGSKSHGRTERWPRLSEQFFRIDKWSICRGQAAKRRGSGVK